MNFEGKIVSNVPYNKDLPIILFCKKRKTYLLRFDGERPDIVANLVNTTTNITVEGEELFSINEYLPFITVKTLTIKIESNPPLVP